MPSSESHDTDRPSSPRWGIKALERAELEALHQATLHVLWHAGVKVEDPPAVDIFEAAGATIERRGTHALVRLPASLVEESIRSAPGTFTLHGRDPKHNFLVRPGATGFTAGYGEHVMVIDIHTGEVRPTVKQDLADITRIQDNLEHVSFAERAACSGDQYPAVQAVHNYDAMVRNTSKHVFLSAGGGDNAKAIVAMAEAVAGGREKLRERPIVTCLVSPTSPLSLVTECTSSMIAAIEGGLNVVFHAMSLSGASSPATPVGVVVQHNAEVLSALVLAQAVRKGVPCIPAFNSTMMDLRRSVAPIGVPELALHGVAGIQLMQYYDLPTWAGACASDSKIPDAQQGYDFTLTAMPAALVGANVIYGIGALESVITFDYAAMIMGAEQAGRIKRIVQGIDLSGLDEAVALIEEVGPGGEYITHDHTFAHMRELSSSSIFDRKARELWERDGSKSAADRAYVEARRILASHEPAPLDDGVTEKLDAILAAREAEARAATA
ncbi:MAG: trimethylamine methyltransferase family protein [Actinobacteria bacterium]|nr:trimethylamine methyltransferase family protein [Actinomycetota bacterium]